MKTGRRFSISERISSFRHALKGIEDLVQSEHNFRIHLAVLILVIAAGILLGISASEWIAVILVSAIVLITEAINSSLENLADFVSEDENEKIRKTKDMAAAAVLFAATAAVITGLIIFLPYLYLLWRGFQ